MKDSNNVTRLKQENRNEEELFGNCFKIKAAVKSELFIIFNVD